MMFKGKKFKFFLILHFTHKPTVHLETSWVIIMLCGFSMIWRTVTSSPSPMKSTLAQTVTGGVIPRWWTLTLDFTSNLFGGCSGHIGLDP